MKIEHVAYQVEDPVRLSQWYVDHLGLTVKRAEAGPPFGRFLADDGDGVMLEFYSNPEGEPRRTDSGDELAMLRDPWGLAVQLVRRHTQMIP